MFTVDPAGDATIAGMVVANGGINTSGIAAATTPAFTTGTPLPVCPRRKT